LLGPKSSFYHSTATESDFVGGEAEGNLHVERYFNSQHPSTYKQTRNGLDGMDYSTKFSPWLSLGCISVRRIVQRLKQYESEIIANNSTYWIYFELLWREYFQWYGEQYGEKMTAFSGIKDHAPITSFYPERFQKWCQGKTPYPIVNACMKQLKATGYMSNRGRQLVASCFVHELSLDWRYGAAYMEQQLIDFDLGSNWGNWQYLAGVGADPRGHRQFDLEKQTHIYDPKQQFIHRWQGQCDNLPLDSIDPSDWPINSEIPA
jgi:deoxyribodipyrimidine photo-lyase